MAISKYVIGEETHRDGGFISIATSNGRRRLSERCKGLMWRANIQTSKHARKESNRVIEYCMKDGNWEGDGCSLFPNSKGFVKKKQDFDAWVTYRKNQFKPVAWPVKLLNGRVVERPIQSMKQRN